MTKDELQFAISKIDSLTQSFDNQYGIINAMVVGVVSGAVVFAVIIAFCNYFIRPAFPDVIVPISVGAGLLSLFVAAIFSMSDLAGRATTTAAIKKLATEMEADIQSMVVEFLVVDNAEAVEICSDSPDGPSYCVKLNAYSFVVVRGGYILASASEGNWPSSTFELIRLPNSKVNLSFRAMGKTVEPIATFGSEFDECRYQSGEIVDGMWAEVVAGQIRI